MVAALAYLPDYESGRALMGRGYNVLLVGDGPSSTSDIQALLEEATHIPGLRSVLLPSSWPSDLTVPDGVTIVAYGEVDDVVHQLAAQLGLRRQPIEGNRTVVFWTIKGGAGKTTCTVNTAVALKQLFPDQKVAIWDLDMPKGNLFLAFGRPNALTIEHLLREAEVTPEMLLRHMYHDERTGVHLLLAPTRSDVVLQLRPLTFRRILSMLQAAYDYVLLDFEPEVQRNELLLLTLQEATDIVLVSDFSEFSENALDRLLPVLTALGVRDKARLIYNNIWPDDEEALDLEQQGKRYGLTVLGLVPHQRKYEHAHRQHRPPTGQRLLEPFLGIAQELLKL